MNMICDLSHHYVPTMFEIFGKGTSNRIKGSHNFYLFNTHLDVLAGLMVVGMFSNASAYQKNNKL